MSLPLPRQGSRACHRVAPRDVPLDAASRVDTCVIIEGWWGVGAILVPEKRKSVAGKRVLRPLSYVREPNPSLGWPSWAALDTILVDCGWIPDASVAASKVTVQADDPLFVEHNATVRGWVRHSTAVSDATWDALHPLLDHANTYPYGNELEHVFIEQTGRD
jgi:hypothetical protein